VGQKKICFGGAYGIRSCGDDAALVQMVRMLRARVGDFDGVVISRHAGDTTYTNLGLRTVAGLEFETGAEAAGKWFRGLNPGDDQADLCALRDEIASSDLLILGAGNAFIDITIDVLRGPVPLMTVLCGMAKMTGTPVMWYGMAVGPLTTQYGRDLTRLAASLTDRITLRDPGSGDLVRELAPDAAPLVLPDPVLGLDVPGTLLAHNIEAWHEAHGRGVPVVPVSVRGLGDTTAAYTKAIAETCDRLAVEWGATLLFVPQCTYTHGGPEQDDRTIAGEIIAQMNKADQAVMIDVPLDVDACLSCYQESEVALCTRLHGNVFAAMAGAVPVAIDYNPKVGAFMGFAGLSDLNAKLEDLSADDLMAKLELARTSFTDYRAKIEQALDGSRSEIERYGDVAAELINS